MDSFSVICWYRYEEGNEKDFFISEIEAESEEQALIQAKEKDSRIFKTEIKR